MKRVIGIGNALTDMLVNLKTDSVLGRFKLAKGSMSLVDTRLQTEISKSVAGLPYSLSLGGSAGNTIRAMAQLGCSVGFIGKVGPDTTGDFFVQALDNLGIEPDHFPGQGAFGQMRVADLRRRRAHDGHPPRRGARTLGRRDRAVDFRGVRLPLRRRLSGAEPRPDPQGRPYGQEVRPEGRHRPGQLQHRGREPRIPARAGERARRHRFRQRGRGQDLHLRGRAAERPPGHFADVRTWPS